MVMNSPAISVIVTAYNRHQFLENCLSSLAEQSCGDFEVILVTNFEYDIKSFDSMNIKHIVMSGSVGEFLAAAILNSAGELLCFLDDDDTFMKNKIQVVKKFFKNDRVAYLHNYARILTDSGLHSRLFFPPDFNMSCISIRKDITLKHIDNIKTIVTGQDSFFYTLAVCSGGIVKGIKKKLTTYRVHKKNTTSLEINRQWLDTYLGEITHFKFIFNCKTGRNYLTKLQMTAILKMYLFFDVKDVLNHNLNETITIWIYLYFKALSDRNLGELIRLNHHFGSYIIARFETFIGAT